MAIDVQIFGSFMEYRILDNVDGIPIITTYRDWKLEWNRKILKEIKTPLKLTSSNSHAPVLNLDRGSRNLGLFLGSPRYEGRAEEHVITRERTTSISTGGLISI